jgi:hypothetical protein
LRQLGNLYPSFVTLTGENPKCPFLVVAENYSTAQKYRNGAEAIMDLFSGDFDLKRISFELFSG